MNGFVFHLRRLTIVVKTISRFLHKNVRLDLILAMYCRVFHSMR